MMQVQIANTELLKIIGQFNETQKEYGLKDCSLHQIIQQQVDRTPDAIALKFEETELSYGEYNKRANQVAHYLIKEGVEPETFVGICVERSFEMLAGVLGILKAGGAYIPFDPEYPQKRLQYIIEDANVNVILTQKKFQDKFRNCSQKIIILDDPKLFSEQSVLNPPCKTTPDNLAYVIYTSGSTGNPKGAMNEHKGIVNRLLWMQDTYTLTGSDRVLQKTPYSFDVSVWELFWPHMFGACLVIAKPEGHKDTDYLVQTIVKEKITVLHFVPSMLRLFLEEKNLETITSIRDVIVSGEAITHDLQKLFFEKINARLHNLYGPTEAAIDVTFWECRKESKSPIVPIGKPVANTQMYILDDQLLPVPIGETGELHIGGIQVGRGYLNRPELTREKFINDPFSDDAIQRLYKTGDLARYLPDGNIEYLGRIDHQVKIRGFRIELGEIEAALMDNQSIRQCAVIAREDTSGDIRLVAYIVEKPGQFSIENTRKALKDRLPEYMIPSFFVLMQSLPLNHSGKTDRKALPRPEKKRPELSRQYIAPRSEMEKSLEKIWCDILNLDCIGIDDNFFDLGGNSLLGLRLVAKVQQKLSLTIPIVKVFQYPSISLLAGFLENRNKEQTFLDRIEDRAIRQRIGRFIDSSEQDGVAIIGMAGKFPGAATCEALWENLCNGIESITFFKPEELTFGVDIELLSNPDYVLARGVVEDADKFDAPFFGISPVEAKIMDPQQRVFLELAWTALENAGYDSESFHGMIGMYAGVGDNHYYPKVVLTHRDLVSMVGEHVVGYGNEKDYIATRASYALNLTGPSVSANTGCSTSLLSVDNAFHALINYECDMALAGGVDIAWPQKHGFLYEPNGVFANDGHCRPFDRDASGTLFNDGAGIVVLKRLKDALADGDRIYAIIKGSAKNNDGANKVSFLAPSVDGQAQVIAMAQAHANVSAESISYIETHGTGTPLGDPIEIEALTKAFRVSTDKKQFCLIGSIKGNIGHPTIASGVAGLIKATLALYHAKIPATLHYKNPNPKIDFADSPFKVVDRLTDWPKTSRPRRAGVSSFGFGGTNVHTILEEAPGNNASEWTRPSQLILLSAKTENALTEMMVNLKNHISDHDEINFADTAYTLQTGRRYFGNRFYGVCKDISDVVDMLGKADPNRSAKRVCNTRDPEIVFMFPGQGAQYVNMGLNLYAHERFFKETVDICCDLLKPHLDRDLREILYPEEGDEETAYESLKNTGYSQPAIYVIEYALAKLWMRWGVYPAAMIGHSIGEFVCATLSGVISLEDILPLVALRGKLMQDLPRGSMLSVRKPADEIEPRLSFDVQLASINGPSLCVVSGPHESIHKFQDTLEKEGIVCRLLHTSHAFHSAMMDPIVLPFTDNVAKVKLNPPNIPFVSTLTTQWVTDKDVMDPAYWGKHLRMPVRFSEGISRLWQNPQRILLEVGPRKTLSVLARQHATDLKNQVVISSLSDNSADNAEWTALLSAIGALWLNGKTIDWNSFYENEQRFKIPLPSYPFQRKSYLLEPADLVYDISESKNKIPPPVMADAICEPQPLVTVSSRRDKIISQIKTILEETSGIDIGSFENATTFLEMGMDSLLLTQIAFKLQSDFKTKISFGQLMSEHSTITLLADFISGQLPEEMVSAAGTQHDIKLQAQERNDFRTCQNASDCYLNMSLPAASKTAEKIIYEQNETISRLVRMLERSGIETSDIEPADQNSMTYSPGRSGENEKIKSGLNDAIFPATLPQKGIWVSSSFGDDVSRSYNESISIRFKGELKLDHIYSAIGALPQRHDALRARFSADGQLMKIAPQLTIDIPLIDLSALQKTDQEKKLKEFLRTETATAFDLLNGPLFRSTVIKLGKDEFLVVLSAHHIVCDGWSLDVLILDLCIYLNAFRKNTPPVLKHVKSYGEYARLLNARSEHKEFSDARTFWLNKFSGTFPVLNLPTDFLRPAIRSYTAERVDWDISEDTLAGLKKFSAQVGISLFTTILAGLSVLYYRLSGQNNFVIGLPTAEQPMVGQNDLVGHCVNLMPVRCNIDGRKTFLQYCNDFKKELFLCYEHHEYTLISLLEELKIRGKTSRIPLVSVGLTHVKKYEQSELPGEALEIEYFSNPKRFESFEIYINAVESSNAIELKCHYNTNIFTESTIRTWLKNLEVIYKNIAECQDSILDILPILSDDEKALFENLNNTTAECNDQKGIHELFEDAAHNNLNNLAIIEAADNITFKVLDARANKIAHALKNRGIGPTQSVGIALSPSIKMVIMHLGVLKAGASIVVLDPDWSKEQLISLCEKTKSSLLIVDQNENSKLNAAPTISSDAILKESLNNSSKNVGFVLQPEHPAYILFNENRTNGSVLTHQGLANTFGAMNSRFQISPEDKLLNVSSSLIMVMDIFFALGNGIQLHLADSHDTHLMGSLPGYISQHNITILQADYPFWKQLLVKGLDQVKKLNAYCHSEKLVKPFVSEFVNSGIELWHVFGLPETSGYVSITKVNKETFAVSTLTPLENTRFYILDAFNRQMPLGCFGRLAVGGAGVSPGYTDRVDQGLTGVFCTLNTAFSKSESVFITHYRARIKSDGFVEILSRKDKNITLESFTFNLDEIELSIELYPDILSCSVIIDSQQKLNAFVIPVSKNGCCISKVFISYLHGMLPDYMIPASFYLVAGDSISDIKNADAAVLRKIGKKIEIDEALDGPMDEIENKLLRIWQKTFNLDKISSKDNFFDLGGHSLLAAQLYAQIEKVFNKNIPLSTLYHSPSVREMANVLRRSDAGNMWKSLVPIRKTGTHPPLFLIHGAEGNILIYRELAQYIGNDQPVYGLQSAGLDGKEAFDPQFEHVAANYIKEMRELQPQGPYYVAGYCLGGTIAYEIAQQLLKQGQRVAFLAMIENYNIKTIQWPMPLYLKTANKFLNVKYHLQNLYSPQNDAKMKFFLRKAGVEISRMKVSLKVKYASLLQFFKINPSLTYHHLKVDEAYDQALIDYVPKEYPGKLILFVAQSRLAGFNDPHSGWGAIVKGGIDIHKIPVNNKGTLVEPYVRILAEKMVTCLNNAKSSLRY